MAATRIAALLACLVVAVPVTAQPPDSSAATGGFLWTGPPVADSVLSPAGGARIVAIPIEKFPDILMQRAAADIANEMEQAPLDGVWSEWLKTAPVFDCEAFQGGSYSVLFGEYWLFRCGRRARHVGNLHYSAYFLDEAGPPRLGRVEWGASATGNLDRRKIARLSDYLLDTLRVRFRQELPSSDLSPLVPGSSGLLLLAQLRSETGMLRYYRAPKDTLLEPDSLLLIHWSSDYLAADADSTAMPLDEYYFGGENPFRHVETEVAEYLRADWPELASALDSTRLTEDELEVVRSALESSRSRAVPAAMRDAVTMAANTWLGRLSHKEVEPDSVRMEFLRRTFGPYGAGFDFAYDAGICYDRGLLRALWERPCDNQWTEAAFWMQQRVGWRRFCDLCGHNEFPGTELFRPVIERGEAFLQECPNSTFRWDVLATVAEAHETAWSLGKTANGDEYIQWGRYALEAPAHRVWALELYREILANGPSRLATPWLKGRLRRLELDIDTGFHRYWCLWD